MVWAVELHQGQVRDGDDPLPYVSHCFEVLWILRRIGGVTDERLWIAALLHDAIEDAGATRAQIEKRFGSEVAGFVEQLTRTEPPDEEREGLSADEWFWRRSELLLEEIRAMDPEVRQVKLADRISNLREALDSKPRHKLERYVRQTAAILEAIPRETNPALWLELRGVLGEAERRLAG